MKALPLLGLVVFLLTAGSFAVADDQKDKAIAKDRQRIEGVWKIVELVINGNPVREEEAKRFTVVNGSDGAWSLRSEGKVISQGTSTFDPTQKPKTIDFTPTMGGSEGTLHLGIYELGDDERKLCFAMPGTTRPTEANSGLILVKFKRVKAP